VRFPDRRYVRVHRPDLFGDAVTLSGTVSSKAAGEKVTVISRPTGLPEAQTIVTTTTGGTWSLQIQPRVKTVYQAQYDTASSSPVTVSIRPRITLQKVGRHQYLVVVLSARSMAGKTVNITRWLPRRGYVSFRTATLQAIPRTPTSSVAYLTTLVNLGTKLRIFVSASQIGSDYLEGQATSSSTSGKGARAPDVRDPVAEPSAVRFRPDASGHVSDTWFWRSALSRATCNKSVSEA
jgi:hypothetical protein